MLAEAEKDEKNLPLRNIVTIYSRRIQVHCGGERISIFVVPWHFILFSVGNAGGCRRLPFHCCTLAYVEASTIAALRVFCVCAIISYYLAPDPPTDAPLKHENLPLERGLFFPPPTEDTLSPHTTTDILHTTLPLPPYLFSPCVCHHDDACM